MNDHYAMKFIEKHTKDLDKDYEKDAAEAIDRLQLKSKLRYQTSLAEHKKHQMANKMFRHPLEQPN